MNDSRKFAARQAVADLVKAAQDAAFATILDHPDKEIAKQRQEELDKARSRVMHFIHAPVDPAARVAKASRLVSPHEVLRGGLDLKSEITQQLGRDLGRFLAGEPSWLHESNEGPFTRYTIQLAVKDAYPPES